MNIIGKNILAKADQYINSDKYRTLRDQHIREHGTYLGTVKKPSYNVSWYTM